VVLSQLMSKDVNGKPTQEFVSAQQPTASYTSLIEQHAAQLMDELFQDLTPTLEGSVQPSIKTSHIQEPSSLALRIPLEDDGVLEGLVVPFVEMDATLESLFPPLPDEPSASKASEGFVSKVLLGVACLSLVGSAGLWIGTQFHRSATNPAIAQVPTVLPPINPENAAFAEDLKHSLEEAPASPEIAQPTSLVTIPATPVPASSSGLFAANLPTAITSSPTLRSPAVDVPIRNVPSRSVPKASQTFPMPDLANRKLASPPSVNFTATKTTPATRLPTLTAAVLPTNMLPSRLPNVAPAASSQVPHVGQSVSRSAKAGITVQGILDLGDKSAILVARNGSTQNIRMGEVVDSTGWVFLRIENGQAIIQRGSELRSVSGGEQF
jgi:hypothetical protein